MLATALCGLCSQWFSDFRGTSGVPTSIMNYFHISGGDIYTNCSYVASDWHKVTFWVTWEPCSTCHSASFFPLYSVWERHGGSDPGSLQQGTNICMAGKLAANKEKGVGARWVGWGAAWGMWTVGRRRVFWLNPLWGPQGGVLGAFCLSSDQRYKVKRRRWSLTREYIGAHYKKDSILLLV